MALESDAAYERVDHGRAGDDHQSPEEDCHSPLPAEKPVRGQGAACRRDRCADRHQMTDAVGLSGQARDVEVQAALEQHDGYGKADQQMQARAQRPRLYDSEGVGAE